MKKYVSALLGAAATAVSGWAVPPAASTYGQTSRQRRKAVRLTVPTANLTPLEVHRYYTETGPVQVVKRRRGLDGSLRSSMSNRLRDIQLTGR